MSSAATIRIAGVIMAPHKHLWRGLADIYGIGKSTALKICDACGLTSTTRFSELSSDQQETIRREVGNHTVEGDKRREVALAIKEIISLKCYRGLRMIRNLPCRGQRTKTNAKTRKKRKSKS